MRATNYLDMIAVVMLALAALFSFAHEQYGTAVVGAACAGFVGGLACTRLIVQRRDRQRYD